MGGWVEWCARPSARPLAPLAPRTPRPPPCGTGQLVLSAISTAGVLAFLPGDGQPTGTLPNWSPLRGSTGRHRPTVLRVSTDDNAALGPAVLSEVGGELSQLHCAPTQQSAYGVGANVTVPASFATKGPAGGLVLRIRAPTEHAGKLSGVTVGGKTWRGFNASTETVSFSATELTASLIATGLPSIVATFA